MSIPARFAPFVPPGFKLAVNEELEVCPYNYSHYCLLHKRSNHVDKCRRAYITQNTTDEQGVELFPCKYCTTHLIPYVEISWHQDRCPFRKNPELQLGPPEPSGPCETEEVTKKFTLSDLSLTQLKLIVGEYKFRGWEDWDLESALENKVRPISFNPVLNILKGGVPWVPPGLTKKERKTFRKLHHDVANLERGGALVPLPPSPKLKTKRCGARFPERR